MGNWPGEKENSQSEEEKLLLREWAAQETAKHLERLTAMYGNVQFSYRVLAVGGAVFCFTAGCVIVNWGMVRSEVSRESAEVISETIKDERIQFSAQAFSKELLNQLLNDEEIAKVVAKWVMQLLVTLQDEIGALLVKIILQDQVVESVNRLADRLVAYLVANETIQKQVGQLLVDAICLDSSRDASAAWAVDLVSREDTIAGFRDLVVAALQMDAVIGEAQTLALQVLNQVLQNPELVAEARRTLNETLQDSTLRATAKESLWGVILPWGGSKTTPSVPKAIKSIDELAAMDALTAEEKQMLKSLQARMKMSSPPVAPSVAAVPEVSPTASNAHVDASLPTPAEQVGTAWIAKEEAERVARKEADRKLAQEAADRKAKEDAERKAREEMELRAKEEERERRAKELADQLAREEVERIAKEEDAQRIAQIEEDERKAREENERRAKEQADRALEEAERIAKAREEEEERFAREENERRAKQQADRQEEERKVREANERIAKERAREEAERIAEEYAQLRARDDEERRLRKEAERQARDAVELERREAAKRAQEAADLLSTPESEIEE